MNASLFQKILKKTEVHVPFSQTSTLRAMTHLGVLAIAIFLAGCATKNFGPLPQSDEDFQKPPEAIQAEFAGVTDFPGKNQPGVLAPKRSKLEEHWGAARDRHIDAPQYIFGHALPSVLLLSLLGASPAGAIGAISPWLIPPSHYVETYEKGDYRIQIHTNESLGFNNVVSWDWTYRSINGDVALFEKQPDQRELRFISRMGALFGSGWARNKFDRKQPKIEGGIDLAYGVETPLIPGKLDAVLLVGIRTPDAVDSNSKDGLNIREFPVTVAAEYRVGPNIKVGAGGSKHFNARLFRNYANDTSLGAPIGVLLTGEYKFSRFMAFGIKAEHLNYQLSHEPSINGDSIALTFNFLGRP